MVGTPQRAVLLLVLVVSVVAAKLVRNAYNIDRGKQSSPADTSDIARTPPAGPSFAEPPVVAGLPIGGAVPEDASVAPLQDRST